jgi:hypothetical protein
MAVRAARAREGKDVETANDFELRSRTSFLEALAFLDGALGALWLDVPGDSAPSIPEGLDPEVEQQWAADAAETYGSRGGVLRRLDRSHEALASYESGAALEDLSGLQTTYCRGNAVKLSLQLGVATLDQLQGDISALRRNLEREMSQPGGDAEPWLWADLGDYQLMLNDVSSALTSYAGFVRRAESGAPQKTWKTLEETAETLASAGDPSAERFARAVEQVRPVLDHG